MGGGDARRLVTPIIEVNGQPVSEPEQRRKMDAYLRDSWARSRQRKSEQHDDQQATEMLNLLPQAFVWTMQGTKGNLTLLHFKPDPQFRPPDLEAKVFAAMEGDMAVDTEQHRIASLKGKLIRDVKIAGGFLGSLNAGGTFDVERRETGKQVWQITETHVHIQGHALLFKTISEQEDDVKTDFKQLPDDITMQKAEGELAVARRSNIGLLRVVRLGAQKNRRGPWRIPASPEEQTRKTLSECARRPNRSRCAPWGRRR